MGESTEDLDLFFWSSNSPKQDVTINLSWTTTSGKRESTKATAPYLYWAFFLCINKKQTTFVLTSPSKKSKKYMIKKNMAICGQ
jgi:hypothetical protein